jgi:hypothetical protein
MEHRQVKGGCQVNRCKKVALLRRIGLSHIPKRRVRGGERWFNPSSILIRIRVGAQRVKGCKRKGTVTAIKRVGDVVSIPITSLPAALRQMGRD